MEELYDTPFNLRNPARHFKKGPPPRTASVADTPPPMELSLSRRDLQPSQGSGCAPRTLALLRASKAAGGKSKPQKVVVGRDDGSVACLVYKKGEMTQVFKTAAQNAAVGGVHAHTTAAGKDRILFGVGGVVRGVTKKGKVYKEHRVDVGDAVQLVWGSENETWICSEFQLLKLQNWKDQGVEGFPDKITDLLVAPLCDPSEGLPVLACADRMVRIGKDGSFATEVAVDAPVGAIAAYRPLQSGTGLEELTAGGGLELVYGTEQGTIGGIMVDTISASKGWDVKGGAGVTTITAADLSGDGVDDIIVARNDG